MKPDFQCVITRWNLGFMAIRQTPPAWIVILMVPVCPESGFQRVTPSLGPLAHDSSGTDMPSITAELVLGRPGKR